MTKITVQDEQGAESYDELADHMRAEHNWHSDREWSDAHLERVHNSDHRSGEGITGYHAHPKD